jgi:hypothetical protein
MHWARCGGPPGVVLSCCCDDRGMAGGAVSVIMAVPYGRPLTGHTDRVSAVAAVPLPDGRVLLASASVDGTVRLWDPQTGAAAGAPLTGHTGRVLAVAAVPASAPDWRP